MTTAQGKRIAVRNAYRSILGRNKYSQAKRDYCFKKYSDGNYYSDCSSSISYSYKEAGYSFGILNTVGMYESAKLKKVDAVIKNGVIQDPEALRIGDMLLFAGTDSGRKYAGYVGHVEMVGEISGSTITLYGHGSGTPSRKDMDTYCRQRYAAKTSTALGNKGLIKVVRFIQDDESLDGVTTVKDVQKALLAWNKNSLPKYGIDGEWGSETENAVKAFQTENGLAANGELNASTLAALGLRNAVVKVTGGSVYLRGAPNVENGKILGIAKSGETLLYQGKDSNGWHLVEYKGQNAWISGKYSAVE